MINFQFQDGDTPLNIAKFQRKTEKDVIHLLSNPASVREVSIIGKSILICLVSGTELFNQTWTCWRKDEVYLNNLCQTSF